MKCNFNNTTTVPLAVTQAYNPIAGTYRVTADQTIAAGASLQNIPGLSWTLPANLALNISYACNLVWVQNTAAAADSFGFQDVTNAPTNVFTYASADNVSGSKAGVTGITDGAPGTAATTMINVTPGAAATFYGAYFTGTIEQPSNASTSAFNIMAQFTTNSGVIKRGSFCQVF